MRWKTMPSPICHLTFLQGNNIKKPPNTFMPFLKGPSEFLQNGSRVVNAHLGKMRVFLISADQYYKMNAAIFSIRALIFSSFIVWQWWRVSATGGWIYSPVLVFMCERWHLCGGCFLFTLQRRAGQIFQWCWATQNEASWVTKLWKLRTSPGGWRAITQLL